MKRCGVSGWCVRCSLVVPGVLGLLLGWLTGVAQTAAPPGAGSDSAGAANQEVLAPFDADARTAAPAVAAASSGPAKAPEPVEPAALAEEAARLFREGQLDAAIVALRTVLEQGRTQTADLLLLARAYLARGQTELAEQVLDRAVLHEPPAAAARLLRGQLAVANGNLPAGVADLEAARAAGAELGVDGMLALFAAYRGLHRPTEADALATQLAASHGDNAAVRAALADSATPVPPAAPATASWPIAGTDVALILPATWAVSIPSAADSYAMRAISPDGWLLLMPTPFVVPDGTAAFTFAKDWAAMLSQPPFALTIAESHVVENEPGPYWIAGSADGVSRGEILDVINGRAYRLTLTGPGTAAAQLPAMLRQVAAGIAGKPFDGR